MKNIIIALILIFIVAFIVLFLWRAKKRGEHCIGCPYAKQCGGKCDSNCYCDNNKSDINNK